MKLLWLKALFGMKNWISERVEHECGIVSCPLDLTNSIEWTRSTQNISGHLSWHCWHTAPLG